MFIVTGKGGTGKTTVSGVMANLAADEGLRAMVFQIGAPGARDEPGTAQLARLFGSDEVLGYEASVLKSNASGGERQRPGCDPGHGVWSSTCTFMGCGACPGVWSTAAPLTSWPPPCPVCPTCSCWASSSRWKGRPPSGQPDAPDVVVLDAPAAGHAVRFLQSPRGLLDATAGGPVRAQAEEVVQMLSDPQRCQVVLVTTPEETPVSETVETAHLIEERAGVSCSRS